MCDDQLLQMGTARYRPLRELCWHVIQSFTESHMIFIFWFQIRALESVRVLFIDK